jgi:hypothetical protein
LVALVTVSAPVLAVPEIAVFAEMVSAFPDGASVAVPSAAVVSVVRCVASYSAVSCTPAVLIPTTAPALTVPATPRPPPSTAHPVACDELAAFERTLSWFPEATLTFRPVAVIEWLPLESVWKAV